MPVIGASIIEHARPKWDTSSHTAIVARPLAATDYVEISLDDFDDGDAPYVGVTTATHYHSRGLCGGLFYGGTVGNLSNGFKVMKHSWGPGYKIGDRAGILVKSAEGDDRLKVYFYQNGEPLGCAYDVSFKDTFGSNEFSGLLHWVITMTRTSSRTKITLRHDTPLPTQYERMVPQGMTIEGGWRIYSSCSAEQMVDEQHIVRVKHKSGDEYVFQCRIGNFIKTPVRVDSSQHRIHSKGRTVSTRMKYSPHLRPIEMAYRQIMESNPEFEVTEAGGEAGGKRFLTLRGDTGEQMVFQNHDCPFVATDVGVRGERRLSVQFNADWEQP